MTCRLSVIMLILVSMLLVGCITPIPEVTNDTTPPPMPTLKQTDPGKAVAKEDVKVVPETKVTVTPSVKKEESKVEENKNVVKESEVVLKNATVKEVSTSKNMLSISAKKVFDKKEMNIKMGDSVEFKNADTWPHLILIDDAVTKKRVIRGERLNKDESWSYTFDKKGVYAAHDMWSSTAWLNITVE